MKRIIFILFVVLTSPAFARGGGHSGGHGSPSSSSHSSGSSHQVSGQTTKNGAYVKPHRQTNPDKTQRNNWSTKGNVNPYTGKKGTKKATH